MSTGEDTKNDGVEGRWWGWKRGQKPAGGANQCHQKIIIKYEKMWGEDCLENGDDEADYAMKLSGGLEGQRAIYIF